MVSNLCFLRFRFEAPWKILNVLDGQIIPDSRNYSFATGMAALSFLEGGAASSSTNRSPNICILGGLSEQAAHTQFGDQKNPC